MSSSEAWYVVKQEQGHCEIVPASEVAKTSDSGSATAPEQWGPFESEGEAIARRIGLIRAGKCKPA